MFLKITKCVCQSKKPMFPEATKCIPKFASLKPTNCLFLVVANIEVPKG